MSTEQNGSIPESLAPDDDARDRSIIEALLTAADEPLSGSRLAELLQDGVGPKQVADHIDELNQEYMNSGRAFRIKEVAGGYQFAVHTEFAPWIRSMLNEKGPTRLSQAALETLAIIAFKQPITKAEMEHVRGVNVDGVLRTLMEKGLVRISGRAEGVGRPLLYGTARDFLKFFGLNTLNDLPKLREIEELMKEEETLQGGLQAMAGVRAKSETGTGDEDGGPDSDDADDLEDASADAAGRAATGDLEEESEDDDYADDDADDDADADADEDDGVAEAEAADDDDFDDDDAFDDDDDDIDDEDDEDDEEDAEAVDRVTAEGAPEGGDRDVEDADGAEGEADERGTA